MTDTKPLAVVTGASSGIGFELAKQFARHGYDLVINAEDEDLGAAAEQLRTDGIQVEPVQADLRSADGVEQLYGAITATARPVSAAVLNAGVGQGGAFVDTDLADEIAIIDLNITSTVRLAKRLLRDMVARGEGRMLISSSIASTMPGSYQAVYNASKAFLQSFGVAVRDELRGTGVTVTSLMPGPTDTDFFARAGLQDSRIGQAPKDDPAQVARMGFDALMKGEERVVASSVTTKAMEAANKVLPDKVKAAAHRVMSKPGSGSP